VENHVACVIARIGRIACIVHASARVRASEGVVKRSLILDGFSSNLLDTYYNLQSSMGYVLFMFMHRARAWLNVTTTCHHEYYSCPRTARACASAHLQARAVNFRLSLNGFSPNLEKKTYYGSPQVT
jgi:hypothetical protein